MALRSTPIFLAILFETVTTWSLQVKCWSTMTLRNLDERVWTLGISLILMVLSFFLSEENIMKLFFSKLRDNLFALNQLAIMINSEFIISIRWSRDLWDKKTFVSSANKMSLRSWEVIERSFMYSKNNKGPSIENWGTPQVINWVNYEFPL